MRRHRPKSLLIPTVKLLVFSLLLLYISNGQYFELRDAGLLFCAQVKLWEFWIGVAGAVVGGLIVLYELGTGR